MDIHTFQHWELDDETAIVNFFSNQSTLQTVEIKVNKYYIDKGLLKPVLFQILNNCCQVQVLDYCRQADWINMLTEIELSRLHQLMLKLKTVSFHKCTLRPKSLSLFLDYGCRCFVVIIQRFVHLQHLTLLPHIPDEFLQEIFQYLVSLHILLYLYKKMHLSNLIFFLHS